MTAATIEGTSVLGRGKHSALWPIGVLAGVVMAAGTILLFEPVTSLFPIC